MEAIQKQVKLPLKVALDVALQGIRIRFGRSVVTVLGVVLGIAFLMSILTGQALKKGLREEDALRTELGRWLSFLSAETGPPKGRIMGVVVTGGPNRREARFLRRLQREDVEVLRVHGALGDWAQNLPADFLQKVPEQGLADGASAILIVGEGAEPKWDWDTLMSGARQRVVAYTRKVDALPPAESVTWVQLHRELKPDEIAKRHQQEQQERYRNIWILVISLLVTVMGITNAMLMSVTERFREIGTMKCLGALSSFVRSLFLLESSFIGLVGGLLGCIGGTLFTLIAYSITYGFGLTFTSFASVLADLAGFAVLSTLAGIILSVIAAIYPAGVASNMIPAEALRTNV